MPSTAKTLPLRYQSFFFLFCHCLCLHKRHLIVFLSHFAAMIVIDDKLISDELVSEFFVCQLSACKGACCVQGDAGAPLSADELPILQSIYASVEGYLSEAGKAAIVEQGCHTTHTDDAGEVHHATPLVNGAACAYVCYDDLGIAFCAIQQAYHEGKIAFPKPMSCHLYPVRIERYEGFEAVNYERWNICKPACKSGKSLKVRLYEFLKEPLIRKYGADFYAQLDAAARHWLQGRQG